MACNISYKEFFKDGKKQYHRRQACFSDMSYGFNSIHPIEIKYPAKAHKDLDEKQVNFYVNFLRKILDKNLFNQQVRKFKDKYIIFWDLKTEKLTHNQALLYLTAMRYPEEFYDIVRELYKYRRLPINKLFRKFQQIHFLHVQGKFKLKYHNLAGHGLSYPYEKNFNPVTLREFRRNIKNPLGSVHSFFNRFKPIKEKAMKLEDIWNNFKYQKEDNLQFPKPLFDIKFEGKVVNADARAVVQLVAG